MNCRRWLVTVTVAAVALFATGCGATGLSTPPDQTKVCAPTDADGYVGFGIGFVENTTDSPILIRNIEFIDPVNLTLVGAELEPLEKNPRRGADLERTPTAQTWVPLAPGESTSISALVRADDITKRGSTKGTRVFYGDGSSMDSGQVDIDFWIA